MDLNKLSKEIFENNKEKGFWDDTLKYIDQEGSPEWNAFAAQKLMLIVSELGEAMEALRDNNLSPIVKTEDVEGLIDHSDFKELFEEQIKNTFEDEIADSIIRLLDLCGGYGINIAEHIILKLEYNKTRTHKHGKNF